MRDKEEHLEIDLVPAERDLPDAAIEALAQLLIDDALRTETDRGTEAPT